MRFAKILESVELKLMLVDANLISFSWDAIKYYIKACLEK